MTMTMKSRGSVARMACTSFLCAVVILAAGTVEAQSFNSGSDGSDGPLTIPAGAGTIIFDPFDTARWGRVLDPDGDGVYHFTTITIGGGPPPSTLRLRGDKVNRPMYWLASGDVTINQFGVIDLSGSDGFLSDSATRREVTTPGPGGYAGGAGGVATPSPLPATPGEGPGGGSGGVTLCNRFPPWTSCGRGGMFGASRFLAPLVGGSGGEGATNSTSTTQNGGAGGGALLIASSTSITVIGSILARGGASWLGGTTNGYAGGGSGGAIRLVAPTIAGGGTLNVSGGPGYINLNAQEHALVDGSSGWVRLEGNQVSTSFVVLPATNAITRGGLGAPSTLKPASSIRITTIDGIPVPLNPSGGFQLPDVTINKTTPVSVEIEASGIPHGTVVTLQVYPQAPVDPNTLNLTAQATLSGTVESTTATTMMTFPFGFSRGWVRASWTP